MMRKRLILMFTLSAVCLTGCHKKEAEKKSDGPAEVTVARPQTRTVTLTNAYPATLHAKDAVNVIARVDGRLTSIPYTPGEVREGQVLFEIEKSVYADAVSKAEAALASSEAQREYAETHLAALREALKADAVSRMEVEQAASNLRQIEADIKTAKATLSDARTQLDYCTIRAPFSGRVATHAVDPGTVVSPGTQLTTIYNEDTFSAHFEIEEEQYNTLTASGGQIKGAEVTLTFSQPLAHEYRGVVDYVSPNVNTGTGTYLLHARIENPYKELRQGMYVTVNLPYREVKDALLVLAAAIGSDQQGEYLYTLTDSSRVAYTPVITGPMIDDTLRMVSSGLTEDTPYLTKALLKVRPGEKVKGRYE